VISPGSPRAADWSAMSSRWRARVGPRSRRCPMTTSRGCYCSSAAVARSVGAASTRRRRDARGRGRTTTRRGRCVVADIFTAAFLVTHRPIDDTARAVASRHAWERAIRRWAARERKGDYQREYQPKWNARRITDGRCAACRTRMAPPDRATCQPCRDQITARRDRRRADRIAAGICGDCGKHPLASTARCTHCLARDAVRHARRKAHMEGLR